METLKIRKISVNDIEVLKEIGILTFTQTFSAQNTEENLRIYLEKEFTTQKLRAELIDKNSEFYFAEFEGETIGYLKVNLENSQTEIRDDKSLEIERIYVVKKFHGKKVGQILYEKAIAIATNKMLEYVWLGVWEKNLRAIRFYEKNGFVTFDKHLFKLGNDEQTDIMMKLKIK